MGANEFQEVGHRGVAPRPPLHLSGVKPWKGEKWIPSLRAPPQSHREAVKVGESKETLLKTPCLPRPPQGPSPNPCRSRGDSSVPRPKATYKPSYRKHSVGEVLVVLGRGEDPGIGGGRGAGAKPRRREGGAGLWGSRGRGLGGAPLWAWTSSQCSRRTGLDFCANQSCPPAGKEPAGDDERQGVW